MAKRNMTKLKALAEQMFVEHGKTAKQISDELGVSENTIGKWRKEGNWDDQKNFIQNAPHRIEKKLLEEMERITNGDQPTFNADALSKVKSAYNAIKKDVNPGTIYSVLKKLDHFIVQNYPDKIIDATDIHRSFLQFVVENE